MRPFIIILLCITFCSCGGGDNDIKENKGEILSILTDTLTSLIPQRFPPLPVGYTLKDSLQTVKTKKKLKEQRNSKIHKIAIPPYLSSVKGVNVENLQIEEEFKKLVYDLKTLEAQPLDLSLINTDRNDSIIEFNENLLDPQVSDFLEFDLLITFSRIAFNENGNKAVVIGTSSTSGLAGFSALYFFERTKEKWNIVKSITLWIS